MRSQKGKAIAAHTQTFKKKPCIQLPCLSLSSASEASSTSESENIPEINSELIDFIGGKKNFVRQLISDASFSSPLHTRSDRLTAREVALCANSKLMQSKKPT